MAGQGETTAPAPKRNQSLRVSITSRDPDAWTEVLHRTMEFMKARTECYVRTHKKYDHGARGYLEDRMLPLVDNQNEVIYRHWKELLESGDWKKHYKPRRGLGPITQEAQQSDTNDALTTPSNRKFRLLDLPIEIIRLIFEHMVGGPYELHGNLIRLSHHGFPDNDSTQLIFHQPRVWADLVVFRINRAFRNLAIDYYGVPRQDSLPFSHVMDTVVIHGEELDHFGYDDAVEGVAFSPNLWLQDWGNENHWLLHDGVYSFDCAPSQIKPWTKPMALSADFLQKPRKITMAVDNGTTYQWDWEQVWRLLGKAFVSTRHLKLNICHMDACGFVKELERPQDHEIGEAVSGKYKAHDLWVLFGLSSVMYESFVVPYFPKLGVLEVEKITDCCSHMWRSRSNEGPSIQLGFIFVQI
ncbi:hypothetical protein F5Y13DRAFT_191576 [Hypoxylon sp. FL1857]|nr:hypothetical protein F5Y13DRAFT_191576 [Hypoxylon sp. FL1857]